MNETDFPEAKLLGEAILEDPAYPSDLKDLLFESLRLHRLFVGRKLVPHLRPRRFGDGSWLLPEMVVLPSGEEARRPWALTGEFTSTTQRFEIALHRELLFGRLRVRGRPVDRPEDSVLLAREMWDMLTPTLAFMPVVRGAASEIGFLPNIGAQGDTSEYRFLKPVPRNWVAPARGGCAKAEEWMTTHVTVPRSWKRQSAIGACRKATGCTVREAETAWGKLPQALRPRSGRPRKYNHMK
jgi:hypothetical protein